MSFLIRSWTLMLGLSSRLLSLFERRNPEALLEAERERLRKLVGRFNAGLISHATMAERLMSQVKRKINRAVNSRRGGAGQIRRTLADRSASSRRRKPLALGERKNFMRLVNRLAAGGGHRPSGMRLAEASA